MRPVIAIVGRPNVGKSTLINAWLGEERLVAFDQPGTTRDAIHVPFERDGRKFELIDTAGLRRRGKVFEAIEKFSVVKTLQAIADAHVVLLLLDATQGVSDQDAHIAGYVLESGRAVVVAVNKWDATDDYQRQTLQRSIETRLAFLKYAPVLNISAIRRTGLSAVWKAILQAHASATVKMPTPVLTRLLQAAAFPDTIIARTIPERGMLEWTSGVLQIVVLILGIGVLIATILLILSMRAGVQKFNQTVDRLSTETKPLLANATAIVGDAREVVAMLRTDIERVTEAAEALSEQLLGAADATVRRVDNVNAVLDVLQDELEDTALSAVSAIRGVRVGAGALTAGMTHPRPRRTPVPVNANDDDA